MTQDAAQRSIRTFYEAVNMHHRLIYQAINDVKVVKIIRMRIHCE
jgi:Txe/YoeB family toxin of Txe-Axe toxin-antitoxin module